MGYEKFTEKEEAQTPAKIASGCAGVYRARYELRNNKASL
jgi:hypothetical protein